MISYTIRCVIFSLLFTNSLVSQTIKGAVIDDKGNPVSNVTFLIKKDHKTSAISEFFTANKAGKFSYKLKKSYPEILYVSSSMLGFEKQTDSIKSPKKGKLYILNFNLLPTTTALEEVILVQKRAFVTKKDTVVFNPEAYRDGTERKVEDILRKVPGIEIENNGRIKYRGKAVAEVQLDGDDLFGSNYTIGTKNISVDIIDKIEAIDNFSKNPLLKGIENSERTALNLKLKKGKTDYSGNGDLGLGYGDQLRYDLSTNILGVSKKIKSFGTFSFNNIGFNRSSFDYFSTDITIEELLNIDLYGKKNIEVVPQKPGIGDARIRLNNEFSSNYNLVQSIGSKLKIRYNIFYVKDQLRSENLFENNFFTSEENISFSDRTSILQKPEQLRFDVKTDYKLSNSSLLEMESSISKQTLQDRIDFRRDEENLDISELQTKDFFWKNKLLFTHKLDKALVLQFSSLYARNNLPQSFRVDGNFILETNNSARVNQHSEFRKESFQNSVSLLGRKKRLKYDFSIGANFYDAPFLSRLTDFENNSINDFQNNIDYKKRQFISNASLNYQIKKWRINSMFGWNYIRQNYEDQLNSSNAVFEDQLFPKILLNLKYVFNQTSSVSLGGSLDYTTPDENYLFSNNIVTSNRVITNNLISLELSRKYKYRLNYRLDDLSKSIEIKASLGYSIIENPYVSSFDITDNLIRKTNFQADVVNEDLFLNFSVSKYIRFLRSTVMHASSYRSFSFNNVINESEFRENTSNNYTGDIFFRTSLSIPINFENNFSYTLSSFSSSTNLTNTNNSLKNTFRIIYKPNKSWVFSVFNYYFIPDLDNTDNSISFLDLSLRFKPKKIKWLSGRFIGKNLLDTRLFEQVNNSDFSTSVYQSNLIPRYFMLSLDFSF
ncbi:hypothetical protein [uncultured Aquimarina sp.]|uniref:hypothetical protein n=1 Tax=uncultured Aquimarina sp. TaxID=575652 RepID=UPI0026282F82|nr:hypothetical protein [uncultured Aquimarina sp.]